MRRKRQREISKQKRVSASLKLLEPTTLLLELVVSLYNMSDTDFSDQIDDIRAQLSELEIVAKFCKDAYGTASNNLQD